MSTVLSWFLYCLLLTHYYYNGFKQDFFVIIVAVVDSGGDAVAVVVAVVVIAVVVVVAAVVVDVGVGADNDFQQTQPTLSWVGLVHQTHSPNRNPTTDLQTGK